MSISLTTDKLMEIHQFALSLVFMQSVSLSGSGKCLFWAGPRFVPMRYAILLLCHVSQSDMLTIYCPPYFLYSPPFFSRSISTSELVLVAIVHVP